MKTVSIVGPGRLGGALAIALSRVGFRIEMLVYRSVEPPSALLENVEGRPSVIPCERLTALDSDVILLTTADTDLDSVAKSIASKIGKESVLLHTSGALSSDILNPAARLGVATGSIHPLVSVSDPDQGAHSFAGAFFCVEGAPEAVTAAEEIVRALGGKSFSIDSKNKPLYHASAVLASGHVVSLFSAAVDALSHCGIEGSRAKEILLPLIESTVANLSRQEIPAALTGPFARTDREAVERHLDAFDSAGLNDTKTIYLALGLEALRLAEIGGGDSERIDRIRNLIKLAQDSGK